MSQDLSERPRQSRGSTKMGAQTKSRKMVETMPIQHASKRERKAPDISV